MAKITATLSKSVFYLFRQDPKTGKVKGPYGTGCVVARRSQVLPGELHYYAVTNWHVACDIGASIIRLNTKNGGVRFVGLEPEEWHFLRDGDDLAAVDITDLLELGSDDVAPNPEHGFITPDIIEGYDIAPGDDVFMCGLFLSHHGGKRNVPSMRFGNLSMLANAAAPVKIETGAWRPSHLVDMRSRTGFSGSPVFAYRVPWSDLTVIPGGWIPAKFNPDGNELGWWRTHYFLGLLGIHCSQFWDTVEVQKQKKRTEDASDAIRTGDKLLIQSSMTIIVPAWRISELLDAKVFEMARKKRDEERQEDWARRPRPESVGEDEQDDQNPVHKEDFNRLLDRAAARRKSDKSGR